MRTLTLGTVAVCYALLRDAKLTGMKGVQKLHVVELLRALQPTAKRLEDARRDAQQSLRPEKFEERLAAARDFEKGKTPAKMTRQEYDVFIEDLKEYNRLVGESIGTWEKEPADAPTLRKEVFTLLIDANDWTAGQCAELALLMEHNQ